MDKINVRDTMTQLIKMELLGPGSEGFTSNPAEEIIWEKPSKRYSTGILFPIETKMLENEDILEMSPNDSEDSHKSIDVKRTTGNFKGEEPIIDSSIDDAITLSNQLKPSSMGMTFFAEDDVKQVNVSYSYGMYQKSRFSDIRCKLTANEVENTLRIFKEQINLFEISDECISLKDELSDETIKSLRQLINDEEEEWVLKAKLRKIINYKYSYRRTPYTVHNIKLEFVSSPFFTEYQDENIRLFAKRKYLKDCNKTSFTIVMINKSEVNQERNTIFQPYMKVESSCNNWELAPYSTLSSTISRLTEEEKNLELLFHNKQKYGIGHGVSVNYIKDALNWIIETTFLPEHETQSMDFDIDEIPEDTLSMENLSSISSLTDDQILSNLEKLPSAYSKWLQGVKTKIYELDPIYYESAMLNFENANIALKRMEKGINTLRNNKHALDAFKDANLAMLMQRVQGANKVKNTMPEDNKKVIKAYANTNPAMAKWRSFQLAFFIMSIESLVDSKSEFRDLVDLIWVPTGGGKTEAYLALTAFTIFFRKLNHTELSHGTTVIMRYTLRLLAAQQFLRATSMICACELIRKDKKKIYGDEEISVGLWIGSNVTPNSNKEAKTNYNKLNESRNQYDIDKYYKFQLLECPWCGTKLVKEYKNGKLQGKFGLTTSNKKVTHKCTNKNCDFYRKLPVKVVDDYIYEQPPTLLFATVDKFATLPWRGEVSEIFGNSKESMSPELIIQDELHLISGPLGTIVGLYETVIDHLCSQKGIKPKIIASTATIRNAQEQVKNLYARDVSQFPPPLIDIDDSYFIKANPLSKKFGRKYIGVMPSGKTQTTTEIRLMGKLLQTINEIDCDDDEKDAYWTLVGYFNSIRELGKCTTLVNDDIKDFMRRLSNRNGNKLRYIYQADELTSRVSSNDILRTLDKLELNYSKRNKDRKIYPSDVLLATNMISVGVDVPRLNLMVIVGQPKLTAEYIQASSRVGRKDPGLIYTLYDSAKTRDRSHYENFKSYHDSFYYYVEPTSLTPFSEAAVDKAIHALIVTLMRHSFGFNKEEDSNRFQRDGEYINEIKEILLSRVKIIDPDATDMVLKKIDRFFEFWNDKLDSLDDGIELRYTRTGKSNEFSRLLKDFGRFQDENAYDTLRAMRNVDTETKVHLRRLRNER